MKPRGRWRRERPKEDRELGRPVHEYAGTHRDRPAGRRGRRFDYETLACALRGHITPAADVRRLRPQDEGLGFDLPDGRRFVRCIRCDAWMRTAPPAQPLAESLPALAELELPQRGRELRSAFILRLIAIDRAIHFLIFGALAGLFFYVDANLSRLKSSASSLLQSIESVATNSGRGYPKGFIRRDLSKFLHLQNHTLILLGLVAVVYCVVEGVEAVGLWMQRRWAEYLTALATAGFLPLELYEIAARVTVARIVTLVVNIAILLYLLWAKRLFGIRGGPKAEREEGRIDPEEVFGPAHGKEAKAAVRATEA